MTTPGPWRGAAAKILFAAVLFAVALEGASQVYVAVLGRGWARTMARPDHYFRRSENPALGYELKPDFAIEKDGRTLQIDSHGLRAVPQAGNSGGPALAVLGDSVVFGTGFSQEQTIPCLLQENLGGRGVDTRVWNLGVPGYNLAELAEQLRVKGALVNPGAVVYILNLNDFCRRDTIYEGGDNGLYRMYRRPPAKALWCFRKLVYRLRKGEPASAGWYRWIFNGTRSESLAELDEIVDDCRTRGRRILVILLPACSAYADGGGYALAPIHDQISARLRKRQVEVLDTTADFASSPGTLMTGTDHLTLDGNRLMARRIAEALRPE